METDKIPDIDQLFNVYDFHSAAMQKMLHSNSNNPDDKKKRKNKDAYNFYVTGVLDEVTLRENQRIYSKIWLRPRILVGVKKKRFMDTSIQLFGGKSDLPFYITATTRSNLANINGEIEIMKAAYNKNAIYMIPSGTSLPHNDVIKYINTNHDKTNLLWYQLYTMNASKAKYKQYVKDKLDAAMSAGIKVICLTVDSPSYIKRERYLKVPGNEWMANLQPDILNPYQDWALVADIVKNYVKKYGVKLFLKGVGCGEDCLKAYYFEGVSGVILSNHGGRQGEYTRSSIEVLIECMDMMKKNNIYLNNVDNQFEIFVDGGIRRGTDIFKALCLGAKMVGIGRPIIYGLMTYGQEGVERIIEIFKNELILCMQMMGVNRIQDIRRNMVVYKQNNFHKTFVSSNHQRSSTYSPLPKL